MQKIQQFTNPCGYYFGLYETVRNPRKWKVGMRVVGFRKYRNAPDRYTPGILLKNEVARHYIQISNQKTVAINHCPVVNVRYTVACDDGYIRVFNHVKSE